ncbi:MAG: bifunctional 5,10-methylenetetrahydrofolate dehydrogenase/5,10-methenyltetrahydrofolate cyclohydrolase [bacterium]
MHETAVVIDGKQVAAKVEDEVRAQVERLRAAGVVPRLDLVAIGDDPAFASYAAGRAKSCARVGIETREHRVAESGGEDAARRAIRDVSRDPAVDGILLQMPLPSGYSEEALLGELDPAKDIEGIHPENLGLLYLGRPRFVPCTPKAVLRILDEAAVPLAGERVVVVGRSAVVGRALAILLAEKGPRRDATVTLCHSRTRDLASVTREAAVLIAAIGRARAIGTEHVRAGAVAIDVGTNRVDDPTAKSGSRLVGDLDFDAVARVASRITPVPGGVGPVTVAMLLENTVEAARARAAAPGVAHERGAGPGERAPRASS